MARPALPLGTRDFSAAIVRKRNYIFDTIRSAFELYGFEPLETPAMENLETLTGKYGDEGDKLIFKILNNGLDNPAKKEQANEDFKKILAGKNNAGITERALRYDLTIPFARYVAMNYGQLTMPFKRYQVQPVWRADRPQKGRYREFFQCDADVVGSRSLLNEVELANIYRHVFDKLGVQAEIRLNSRKILAALAEICGDPGLMTDITVAIDKLDKIGIDRVKEELSRRGINDQQVSTIEKYLAISGTNKEMLAELNQLIGNSDIGREGMAELHYLFNFQNLPVSGCELKADFTLARGLDYYTGIIFEVKAKGVQMGSIGGGGRYDDLTGLFGVPGVPGTGISFGVDRIYDVMEELKLFPVEVQSGTTVLFFNLGESESTIAYGLMQQLRGRGISCELFPENAKFDRQFKYADKKNILYAVIIGSKEAESGTCTVKHLGESRQETIAQSELGDFSFS